MKRLVDQLVREMRLSALLYTLIVLIFGIGIWLIAEWQRWQQVSQAAQMITGAAIGALAFSWFNQRTQTISTFLILDQALKEALSPVREAVLNNAYRHYRWDCWLGPIDLTTKTSLNLPSGYLRQVVHRSCHQTDLPVELRMVFVVGTQDAILADYFNDERYVIIYKIDPRDNSDFKAADPGVCEISHASVDGEPLRLKKRKQVKVRYGLEAVEYIYEVPKHKIGAEGTVSLCYQVIKWTANGERFYIPLQFFRVTEDAEFRLSVDSAAGVSTILPHSIEVSHLGAKGITMVEKMSPGGVDTSATIIIRAPVLKGSSVRFELRRDQVTSST